MTKPPFGTYYPVGGFYPIIVPGVIAVVTAKKKPKNNRQGGIFPPCFFADKFKIYSHIALCRFLW